MCRALAERCHLNWRVQVRQTVGNNGCYKSTEEDIAWIVNKVSVLKDLGGHKAKIVDWSEIMEDCECQTTLVT